MKKSSTHTQLYTRANKNNNIKVIEHKKALICYGPGLKIKSAYQQRQAKSNLLRKK